MTLSDFRLIAKIESGDGYELRATVNVTTGILWWRKTVTREIVRAPFLLRWRFAHNGKSTPGYQAEQLCDRWFSTYSDRTQGELLLMRWKPCPTRANARQFTPPKL